MKHNAALDSAMSEAAIALREDFVVRCSHEVCEYFREMGNRLSSLLIPGVSIRITINHIPYRRGEGGSVWVPPYAPNEGPSKAWLDAPWELVEFISGSKHIDVLIDRRLLK